MPVIILIINVLAYPEVLMMLTCMHTNSLFVEYLSQARDGILLTEQHDLTLRNAGFSDHLTQWRCSKWHGCYQAQYT